MSAVQFPPPDADPVDSARNIKRADILEQKAKMIILRDSQILIDDLIEYTISKPAGGAYVGKHQVIDQDADQAIVLPKLVLALAPYVVFSFRVQRDNVLVGDSEKAPFNIV